MKMAGEDGTLTKENFIKILRSSDLFLKAFDKNKDGIVTEVGYLFFFLVKINFDVDQVNVNPFKTDCLTGVENIEKNPHNFTFVNSLQHPSEN